MIDESHEPGPDGAPMGRRAILKGLTALGVGTASFRRALAVQAEQAGKVSPEMIKQAEWIAGLELSDKEREGAARSVQRNLEAFRALREVEVGYDVPPALAFVPAPSIRPAEGVRRNQATPTEPHAPKRPDSDELLAFLPVSELSALVR